MTQIEQMIKDMCPHGVEWKTFADLGTFYGGLSGKNKDDFKDGNAKYITYLNIGCNPALRFDILETVKMGPNEKQNTVQYGDALFTGSSETPDECAMSSVVTDYPQEKLYLNSFCFGFRFNSLEGICPAFYKHYFRSDHFRKAVRRTANGTTRFNVSKKEFAKLEIPIPPLEIQKKIVECLDKFSALAAELQAELQMRRKQYEYYRTHLLTPHSESNSAGDSTDDCNWENVKFSDVASYIRGVTYNKHDELHEQSDSAIKVLRANNITLESNSLNLDEVKFIRSDVRVKQEQYLRKNDIFICAGSGSKEHVGKVAFINEDMDYTFGGFMGVVRTREKVTSKFLYYILTSNIFKEYLIGALNSTTINNLNNTIMSEFSFMVPSLAEQARIVSILDKFESLTTSLSDGIPAEQVAQQKRYEYYRDLLLTFPRKAV